MNPSNYSCIFFTLSFIVDQCKALCVPTASVTFDQPLWLKATEIVVDKSINAVIHLGGFHTMMSYVGSIGTLMEGSGLADVLQSVYGENTVKHMLNGKSIARAIRGHNLVESALHTKLQKMLFDEALNQDIFQKLTKDDKKEPEQVLTSSEDITDEPIVRKWMSCLEALKLQLSEKLRTAKLWLLYMDYIEILRQQI